MTIYTKNWARQKKKKREVELGVHVAMKMLRDKDEEAIRLIGHRTWESERGR